MEPLGWFRSNRGGGAWLAFLALACQLVLTFGHVHFAGPSTISAALAGSANPADDGVTSPPTSPTSLAQDFCAVCSNIALANALILPAPPHTVSPVFIAADLQRLPATFELASHNHFHFSARGPPRA
jgi:hypothetical protein